LIGFAHGYLEALPIFFSNPSLMVDFDNQLSQPVKEIFKKAQTITIYQLVKQHGMSPDQAFALYSRCSIIALPRLTDFLRAQRSFFFNLSSPSTDSTQE
jgi:hypothetical protein